MLIKLTDFNTDEMFYINPKTVERLDPVESEQTILTQVTTCREKILVYGKIDHVAAELNGEKVFEA